MTTSRLALEIWDAIKDEDWVLTANTLRDWVEKLWDVDVWYRHPGKEKPYFECNKLPTAAEAGDRVGCAVRHSELTGVLFVGIARNAVAKQLIGAPQAVRDGAQHAHGDGGVAAHEFHEVLPRQHGQFSMLHDRGIGRAAMAIEHRHFAEEIARPERGQDDFTAIGVGDGDSHLPGDDEIHRVTRIAGPK